MFHVAIQSSKDMSKQLGAQSLIVIVQIVTKIPTTYYLSSSVKPKAKDEMKRTNEVKLLFMAIWKPAVSKASVQTHITCMRSTKAGAQSTMNTSVSYTSRWVYIWRKTNVSFHQTQSVCVERLNTHAGGSVL